MAQSQSAIQSSRFTSTSLSLLAIHCSRYESNACAYCSSPFSSTSLTISTCIPSCHNEHPPTTLLSSSPTLFNIYINIQLIVDHIAFAHQTFSDLSMTWTTKRRCSHLLQAKVLLPCSRPARRQYSTSTCKSCKAQRFNRPKCHSWAFSNILSVELRAQVSVTFLPSRRTRPMSSCATSLARLQFSCD